MRNKPIQLLFLIGLALFVLAPHTWAATGGGGLPWEQPLTTLSNSFTGPVPYAISLVGIVVTGAMVIFGAELGFFARGLIVLVLVIAMLVAAKNFMSGLGFAAGAEITGTVSGEVISGATQGSNSSSGN
jgi:type IV secretion system protein TrbC